MGTKIVELFEVARAKYGLELRAGADGLSNEASWVHMADSLPNAAFLKGGEFVITTGLFVKSGVSLIDFTKELASRGCSAILVNVGLNVSAADIGREVIDFCDSNHLPLFTMPWEVRIVDVMQDYAAVMLQESQRVGSLDSAFESAIYQIPAPEVVLRGLAKFGFEQQGTYRVGVVHNLESPGRVTSRLNRRGIHYHLFEHNNLQVFVFDFGRGELSEDELIEMVCYADPVTVGMSGVLTDLAQLGAAFKRALFSLAVAELWQRRFVGFGELGMLQLLFCVSDQALLEDLHATYLGALEEYDQQHEANLVNTLKVYLLADCNLLESAARLPAHRNTVVYRVRRIKEILGVDLDSATVKFNLLLALYIREYLAM
jgi:hypothetical protein